MHILSFTENDKLTFLFLLEFCIVTMKNLRVLISAYFYFLSHSVAITEVKNFPKSFYHLIIDSNWLCWYQKIKKLKLK